MTSQTGRTSNRRRGAFTLLELIAVLVLISTVLAIAAPSLRGFVHGRQTADTALRMLSLTRLARSRSASLGCVHRLNVDAESGTYWLTMQRAGAFVEIQSAHGRKYHLPTGVSVTLDSPSAEEQGRGEDDVPHIQFYPDGRCDPATIELTGSQQDVLRVTCPSPAESFRVVSPAEDESK